MSNHERGEAGRYTEVVPPDDVLAVFERVEGPVVTSGDVAESLACSRETARRKLRELAAQGHVASRKTAGRVVWWRTDEDAPGRVDADDPFWTVEPGASGERNVAAQVDEILYGERPE